MYEVCINHLQEGALQRQCSEAWRKYLMKPGVATTGVPTRLPLQKTVNRKDVVQILVDVERQVISSK